MYIMKHGSGDRPENQSKDIVEHTHNMPLKEPDAFIF